VRIRWCHVHLHAGVLALDRSIGQRSRQTWEKDTKTHQHRRIALDPETVEVTNPTMHRTPAPDLYDVPLLQFAPTSHP
jgi:hypothetical protein